MKRHKQTQRSRCMIPAKEPTADNIAEDDDDDDDDDDDEISIGADDSATKCVTQYDPNVDNDFPSNFFIPSSSNFQCKVASNRKISIEHSQHSFKHRWPTFNTLRVKGLTSSFKDKLAKTSPKIKVIGSNVRDKLAKTSPKMKVIGSNVRDKLAKTSPKMKVFGANVKDKLAKTSVAVKGKLRQSYAGMSHASEVLKDKAASVRDSLSHEAWILSMKKLDPSRLQGSMFGTEAIRSYLATRRLQDAGVDRELEDTPEDSQTFVATDEEPAHFDSCINQSKLVFNSDEENCVANEEILSRQAKKYVPIMGDDPIRDDQVKRSLDMPRSIEEKAPSLPPSKIYYFAKHPHSSSSEVAKIRSNFKTMETCQTLQLARLPFTERESNAFVKQVSGGRLTAPSEINCPKLQSGPCSSVPPEFFVSVFSPATSNLITATRLLDLVNLYGASGIGSQYFFLTNIPHNDKFTVSQLPENASKNRYNDILCYDKTRVKLLPMKGNNSDYINASFVQGYKQNVAYICCQGPTNKTSDDFWRMIWQENSRLIVMTTRVKEKQRSKCAQYWPPMSQEAHKYQHFLIINTKTEESENYVVCHLIIQNRETDEKKLLYHLLFRAWPDYGVPESADAFLELMHQSRLYLEKGAKNAKADGWIGHPNGPPMVIHCSAGVGRSGTFICSDICMRMLDNIQKLSIQEVTRLLRSQRAFAVQTTNQYLFCHKAMLEYAKTVGLIPADATWPKLEE